MINEFLLKMQDALPIYRDDVFPERLFEKLYTKLLLLAMLIRFISMISPSLLNIRD